MNLMLYLLRHGQTEFSRENCFCGGGLDPDLTEDGHAMAAAFSAAYRRLPWQAIYTSSLRRTQSTARPLATAVGLPLEIRADLREIGYGEWEGKDIETVSHEYHDDYLRWTADPAWYPPTGGEPAVAIASRGMRVIEEIQRSFKSGNVLLVSHKATIRILLCELLGIDVGRFRFRLSCPVGSVSVIEFSKHGPLLHALADRLHLDERLRTLPGT
jgi:broad specificity phosphatase PhoE